MSKDPAFLCYDADMAKDVSHMNRLERGCYFDIIQAQRKFGRLSEKIIRKILGADYQSCWESIELILSYDNDMFFIEWLEDSTNKRKEYSKSRSENRKSAKIVDIPIKSEEKENNISESYVNHMENENENIIVNKKENKNLTSFQKSFLIPKTNILYSEEIEKVFNEYISVRIDMNIICNRVIYQKLLSQLISITTNQNTATQIINQSIRNGYKEFYPLKEQFNKEPNNEGKIFCNSPFGEAWKTQAEIDMAEPGFFQPKQMQPCQK